MGKKDSFEKYWYVSVYDITGNGLHIQKMRSCCWVIFIIIFGEV